MKQHRWPFWLTICVLIFLYLPIISLIISSFNDSRFGGNWTGFSLKWYSKLFEDKAIWTALRNSLLIGLTATVASVFLGTTAAFALHRYKSWVQNVHYGLIYIPLILPDILMGASLLFFFIALNLQLGLFTIFIAHTTFCVSYVTMVMLGRLQSFDNFLIEAAQDLGASQWEILRKIKLPLLAPGIMAAALLSFTLSIDDFVITFFVAGPGSMTLPVYIYGMIKFGSPPIVNALSALLVILTFIIVSLTHYFAEEKKI